MLRCQISVVSFQLSVVSFQLSVVRCPLSVVAFQVSGSFQLSHRVVFYLAYHQFFRVNNVAYGAEQKTSSACVPLDDFFFIVRPSPIGGHVLP